MRISSAQIRVIGKIRLSVGAIFCRRDSFEVVTNDQTSSGLITCSSPAERAEWFSAVSEAIHKASERHVSF